MEPAVSVLTGSVGSNRKRLARALRRHRMEFGRALYSAVGDQRSAHWAQLPAFDEVGEWSRAQALAAIDILERWFATQDPVLLDLFEGWVRSRMVADLFGGQIPDDYRPAQAVQKAATVWAELLHSQCPAGTLATLEHDLGPSITRLSMRPVKRLNILFIGDCIQYEVITALLGPCSRARIEVNPTLLSEKVPALVRNRVREFPPDRFDLVFLSPFSHLMFPEYESLLKPTALFWSAGTLGAQLWRLLEEVRATIHTLAAQFECPVYIHNSAGTIQSVGAWSGAIKNLVSLRNRNWVRREINAAVARFLADPQTNPHGRAQLLDENALRATSSTAALGRVYLHTGAFHPTRLGVRLGSGPYFDAVYAAAHLATKKVIVCDLDNTLWDGVIGEGEVRHYQDRQGLLKELRRRGVLLSINSKNDPSNVRWSGARLEADDFVAPQINWDPKAVNIGRIRDELNLKVKDFVFIDDRPDELERAQNAFPDLHVLDATRPETWRFLGHWQGMLPANPDEDRTRIYHERVQRELYVKDRAPGGPLEDESVALAGLGLAVTIRQAGRSDLKRAVELINRTNQFNLCGSRTTLRELQDRLGAGDAVVVADANDKFGQMGTVGVMVVEMKPSLVEIPLFVLSCRVFGFGIEYALLNSVRRMAPHSNRLVGHYQQTQSNQPCRQMYPKAGLNWDGQHWVGLVSGLPADPTWLSIQNHLLELPRGMRSSSPS
jgi:FkbH-like protein